MRATLGFEALVPGRAYRVLAGGGPQSIVANNRGTASVEVDVFGAMDLRLVPDDHEGSQP